MVSKEKSVKKPTKYWQRKKTKLSKKIKVMIVKKQLSDEYMKQKEASILIQIIMIQYQDSNCDVYYYDGKEKRRYFLEFQKKGYSRKIMQIGLECLKEAAKKLMIIEVQCAGVLDVKKLPSYANDMSKLIGASKFKALAYKSNKMRILFETV